jgi:hypothetical protein
MGVIEGFCFLLFLGGLTGQCIKEYISPSPTCPPSLKFAVLENDTIMRIILKSPIFRTYSFEKSDQNIEIIESTNATAGIQLKTNIFPTEKINAFLKTGQFPSKLEKKLVPQIDKKTITLDRNLATMCITIPITYATQ